MSCGLERMVVSAENQRGQVNQMRACERSYLSSALIETGLWILLSGEAVRGRKDGSRSARSRPGPVALHWHKPMIRWSVGLELMAQEAECGALGDARVRVA